MGQASPRRLWVAMHAAERNRDRCRPRRQRRMPVWLEIRAVVGSTTHHLHTSSLPTPQAAHRVAPGCEAAPVHAAETGVDIASLEFR